MNSTLIEATVDSGIVVLERELHIPLGPQIGWAAVGKRLLDFGMALLVLLVVAPLMIGIALAIMIDSGWPPFFVQKRMGRNGQMFTIFKFRSMYRDAELRFAEIREYNEIEDGPIFKWKADPRITPVGRYLRATSLDEIPQLFNVLLGNMSLVGPRPPLESEVMQYEPWQLKRLAVKPGMTGLWQVSGRSQLGFNQMVELDIAYIDCWSVWQDLRLLLRTPVAVLSARGAY